MRPTTVINKMPKGISSLRYVVPVYIGIDEVGEAEVEYWSDGSSPFINIKFSAEDGAIPPVLDRFFIEKLIIQCWAKDESLVNTPKIENERGNNA